MAIDAGAGKTRWASEIGLNVGDLVATGERVYTGELGASNVAMVRAVDAETGEQLWVAMLGTEELNAHTPIVSEGGVYVRIAHDVASFSMFALEPESGEVRWRFDREDVLQGPTVGRGLVYAGSGREVIALDETSGERRWTVPTDGPVVSAPALAEGALLVATRNGSVMALQPETGRVLWQERTGDERTESLAAVAGGVAYVVGSGADGMVLNAIDIRTGEERWDVVRPMLGKLTADVAAVSLATSEGVESFDAQTGTRRWEHAAGLPRAKGEVVFVASDLGSGGELRALDSASGDALWSAAFAGKVFSAPGVGDAAVYLWTTAGRLMAFDRSTGAVRWRLPTEGRVVGALVPRGGTLFVTTDRPR